MRTSVNVCSDVVLVSQQSSEWLQITITMIFVHICD